MMNGSIKDLNPLSAQLPGRSSARGSVGGKTINIGEDGATFYPSVSEDGTLSWENDKGLENPTPVNIKGPRGEQGIPGAPGAPGEKGDPGKDGVNGANGKDGINGKDGHTPIKGTDYFTEADKSEMVSAVIAALPKYNGEVESV